MTDSQNFKTLLYYWYYANLHRCKCWVTKQRNQRWPQKMVQAFQSLVDTTKSEKPV